MSNSTFWDGSTSPETMLADINKAIQTIIVGGQSYQIGTRKLTRADLALLKNMRDELRAEINAQESSHLLDDTVVAFFDGR